MLFGALHLADHLLADRTFRGTLGDEFLADGLGGTGSERACAPYGNRQFALTSKRRTVTTSEPNAMVADRKMDWITASLGKVSTLTEDGLLFGLLLRGGLLSLLRGRATTDQRDDQNEHN